VLHGFDDAAPGRELDREVVDVEQRRRGHDEILRPTSPSSKKPQNNPMQSRPEVE
jgi:hypothetical protein